MMFLLVFWLSSATPAFANPDSDCADMAKALKVPPADQTQFRPWCLKFTNACRDIEDDGAQACGAAGPRSRQIDAMMDSVMKLKTNSTITRGDQGLKACDQTDILRNEQIEKCTTQAKACKAKVESFVSPTTGKKFEVRCAYYKAEALAWSAEAVKYPVCAAIEKDQAKALSAMLTQRTACADLTSQLESYSGQTRSDRQVTDVKYDKADLRRCGVAGCQVNPDGTANQQEIVGTTDRPAPRPSPTPTSSSTPSWAKEPEVDTSITYDRPGMQCGVCGCVPNGRGGYNRILKCFN